MPGTDGAFIDGSGTIVDAKLPMASRESDVRVCKVCRGCATPVSQMGPYPAELG